MLKNPLVYACLRRRVGIIRLGRADRRVIVYLLLGLVAMALTHVLLSVQFHKMVIAILAHQRLTMIIIGVYSFATALGDIQRINQDHKSSWLAATPVSKQQLGEYVQYRLFEFALIRAGLTLALAGYLLIGASGGAGVAWDVICLSAKLAVLIGVVSAISWLIAQSPVRLRFTRLRQNRSVHQYPPVNGDGQRALAKLSLVRMRQRSGSRAVSYWLIPILIGLPIGVSLLTAGLLVAVWLLLGVCARLWWIHGLTIREAVTWLGALPLTWWQVVRLLSPGPLLFWFAALLGLFSLGVVLGAPAAKTAAVTGIVFAMLFITSVLAAWSPRRSPKTTRLP
jgi:hypothetical protein